MAVAAVPTQSTQSVDPALHIHTIPMEFYGGKNPAPADVQTASATQTSQLISPSPTAPSQPVSAQKIVIPKNVVTPPSGSSATVQKRSSWMIPAIVCAVVILGARRASVGHGHSAATCRC